MLTGIFAGLAAGALAMSLLSATGYYLLIAQSVVFVESEVPTLIIGTAPIWIMLGVATGVGALLLWLVAGSTSSEILALDDKAFIAAVCIVTGIGSAWLASILWNVAGQRLSVSWCGQLIVSETLFALLFSFLWDGAWPAVTQSLAAVLFTFGTLASIRAH